MTKTIRLRSFNNYKLLLIMAISGIATASVFADSLVGSVNAPSPDVDPVPVKTIVLGESKPDLFRSFAGTSRASQRVSVRSQVAGRLLERAVNLGDRVKKGDVLARLYNPEATPLALEAKQSWEQSQVLAEQRLRDFQRVESLYQSGAAPKQEFENARTNYWAAKKALAAANSRYQRASQVNEEQLIRAPFDGVITQVAIEEGEVITVGQALMQLADPGQVEVEVAVSERIASTLKQGDTVRVTLPLQHKSKVLAGVIQEVTPFRERGALPTVVVGLPNDAVKPGVTAHVHFSYKDSSQFALPISAVIKTGSFGAAVYRVTPQSSVELVAVRPHQIVSNQITLSGDLNQQDRIVIAGTQQLFNGAPVKIIINQDTQALSNLTNH